MSGTEAARLQIDSR